MRICFSPPANMSSKHAEREQNRPEHNGLAESKGR